MTAYSLNGNWKLTGKNGEISVDIAVPCDNYTALLNAGVIPDPFWGKNEEAVAYIGRESWEYSRSFSLTDGDITKSRLLLSCKALDTICSIYINGEKIGEGKNAFLKQEFDIKPFVKSGENTVLIRFESAELLALKLQAEKPLPKNNNGTDGIAYIRKPACHFGWDWGPSIPLCGITDDIEILCFDSRISSLSVRQIHQNGRVTVKAVPEIEGDGEARLTLITPDGAEIPFNAHNEAVVENPQLWWTRELSGKENQPLYTVRAELGSQVKEVKIGLRTVKLNRQEDKYGSNFSIELNGVPIFAKGANWIIPDSLMGRCTEKTYDYYIDSALNANFNIIRIWGGAYYGCDYFYEQCDKKGLLIWQDFTFACLMYPFYEKDFLENVLKETEYNIKRIKSHPSLCLWCGNNEIETMFSYMPAGSELVKWYRKFFYEILAQQVASLDPDTPYIPTSPIGKDFRKGVTADNWGDTHMWNVWHGQKPLNYYRKRYTRFCSEFGLESLPSLDAIREFAEEKELSLTSEVFTAHQKCTGGNRKMLFYLLEKFYEAESFEDMPYMTGLIQKECIADATEHWRRNRGRCNGSIFWQYNDCWQAPSWSSVDFTGKWKPLQYHARHFFEPVCVSVEETKNSYKIYVINDLNTEKKAELNLLISTLDGRAVKSEKIKCTVPPLSSVCVAEGGVGGDKRQLFLNAVLSENGNVISQRTKIFVPDKKLKLSKTPIKLSLSKNGEKYTLTLTAESFCRSVMVDIAGFSAPFSDNYFDLLPNTPKTVTFTAERELCEKDIAVKSLADIPVKKNKIKSALYRLKFKLEPMNIANWFWYSVN